MGTITREVASPTEPASARPDGRRSAVLGLTMGALVAAVYAIAAGRALDYDGSVTVGTFVRHGSLLDVFRTVYNFNNHPYFSFVEHIVWDSGGHGEAWLRVVPIGCAAATVGVLVMWATRRWGAVAGMAAGAVLAANPMFAELGRSVRGYSLMVLGTTVATLVLVDSEGRDRAMTKPSAALYIVALGVAIGTQFYAVLVLVAHVVTLISRRRIDGAWRRRLEMVVAIGVLPYAAMLRPLIASARDRHGTFQPRFPIDAARAIFGQEYVAVVALVVLTLYAIGAANHRRRGLRAAPAAVAVSIALITIWIAVHPLDFYPRFLVWLVPAVAIAVGAATARRPQLAALTFVAVLAMATSQAGSWTTDPIASRQVAQLVEATRAAGKTPCAAGFDSELILGYTRRARAVFTPTQLHGCAMLFADVGTSSAAIRAWGCHFTRARTLRGQTSVVVFSQPRPDPPGACPTDVG